ncbi:MAG: hypothetical protein WA082_01725 [Candidatus Moraniibacteriota bacterium]
MISSPTQKQKSLKAFSMPEVLLSVFILSIGLVTIVAVMAGSLRAALGSQNTIIATELAQEGTELVRNVRDNDFVAGGTGFSDFGGHHCRIDLSSPLTCSGSKGALSQYALGYSGGVYATSVGASEKFYRYIYINYTGGSNERATVRSFVFWGGDVYGALPAINPANTLSSFEGSGNTAGCNSTHLCVFTETFLTPWK